MTIELNLTPLFDQPNGEIGNYQRIIGEGGFGKVYKLNDDLVDKITVICTTGDHKVEYLKHLDLPQKKDSFIYQGGYRAEIGGETIDITSMISRFFITVSEFDINTRLHDCRNVAKMDYNFNVGRPLLVIDDKDILYSIIRLKYVPGTNLNYGCSDITDVAKIIKDISEALIDLEKLDVVSRDISVKNIIYNHRNKEATLVDFGLSFSPSRPTIGHTYLDLKNLLKERRAIQSERRVGHLNFMSPEQIIQNFQDKEITPRSDVFGLGLVLYYLLTKNNKDLSYPKFEFFEDYNNLKRGTLVENIKKSVEDRSFNKIILPSIESALDLNPHFRSAEYMKESAEKFLKRKMDKNFLRSIFKRKSIPQSFF